MGEVEVDVLVEMHKGCHDQGKADVSGQERIPGVHAGKDRMKPADVAS